MNSKGQALIESLFVILILAVFLQKSFVGARMFYSRLILENQSENLLLCSAHQAPAICQKVIQQKIKQKAPWLHIKKIKVQKQKSPNGFYVYKSEIETQVEGQEWTSKRTFREEKMTRALY